MTTGTPPELGGPPAPEKKGRSGFRILLYVLVGLGAVLVLTCGGLAFFAYRDPAIRETIGAAMEAQNAPGAAELRQAGCAQAGVMDMGAAMEAILERAPETDLSIPTLFVSCQVAAEGESLDCDQVARTYLAAVGRAPERFVAQVNSAGINSRQLCQVVFSEDGQRLGTLEEVVRAAGGS